MPSSTQFNLMSVDSFLVSPYLHGISLADGNAIAEQGCWLVEEKHSLCHVTKPTPLMLRQLDPFSTIEWYHLHYQMHTTFRPVRNEHIEWARDDPCDILVLFQC
jgi:hypothetical protein